MSIQQARQHMATLNLEPPEIITDGKIHRYNSASDKGRKKDSWYVAFDNPLTVVFGHWRDDFKHVWRPDGGTDLTDEDKRRYAEARDKRREKQELMARWRKRRMASLFERLPSPVSHEYLDAKQVRAVGLKLWGDRLVVPMRNADRDVVGLQLIWPNGFKRYLRGSMPRAAYHGIGKPNGLVYIAEGYATAATVQAVTGKACCVAFSSNNLAHVARVMRAKLPDARIVICADNDQWSTVNTAEGRVTNPGVYFAQRAASLVQSEYRVPVFAYPVKGKTDFNDLYAAEGPDSVRRCLEELASEAEVEPAEPSSEPRTEDTDDWAPSKPYRALGVDDSHYYYLPHRTNQVVSVSAAGMGSKTNLLQLAPLEWFQSFFGDGDKIDWLMAANGLMRECEQVGTFDTTRIRGRGAWYDNGAPVLHMGDHLLVEGVPTPIKDHKTRYIYEHKPPMEDDRNAQPATLDDARRVAEIFDMLNWDRPAHSVMACGWSVLAPICGALQWRPHVWLTGRRGSGKSYIQEQIIGPLLGHCALTVQSNSTEAGIRQTLAHDARPVVFDEAEAEDRQGQRRMQGAIELARQASSEGGSVIAKGSAGGRAVSYKARSMFLMGSVNVSLSQAADKSRFTVIQVRQPRKGREGSEDFDRLRRAVDDTLTSGFCAAIRARAYRMIPVIRHNAEVFAKAVSEHVEGERRTGDQYGALLAGYWCLRSDDKLDESEAAAIVRQIDWSEAKDSEEASDEQRCLDEILQAQIMVDTEFGNKSRSVGELVQIASNGLDDHVVKMLMADESLRRHGIRVDGGWMTVSDSHKALRKLMEDTPWHSGWGRLLVRLPGSESVKAARFAGSQTRATRIPIDDIIS